MPSPDPKQMQSQATGGAPKSAYPLDRYTVAPKQNSDNGEKSPYYQPSAPAISLPKGGGALKSIDEKFNVNAINGTAGLQVSLPLTPGRNGFTPSLSLQYSSGGGNSEFGLGWSLSLPAIQRRTDKQLPLYDDIANSDVFMLSGVEDLQPSLIYNGTAWVQDIITSGSFTVTRYKSRIEGAFSLIEHVATTGTEQTWWKVTTKDNIVTFYGLSTAGRISDPSDSSGSRIYKWLPELVYDNKGNVQLFTYVTDDNATLTPPAALHEQNRINGLAQFTNTYLSNVSWCNLNYFTPSSAYQPSVPSPDFQMIAVMDYGNYNATAPATTPSQALPLRGDAFSDFHPCFELRTYRRCERVLMFHYFQELNGGTATLVRSLDFIYQSDVASPPVTYTEADYIISITENGYIYQSGTYTKKSLPALSLDYQPLQWNNQWANVSEANIENAPQGLTGPYQWLDLWGEGIPGILTEQADSWFYKRNTGNGTFAPSLAVAQKPSMQGLGSAMQWEDLDADGRRQLVSKDTGMPGYFELDYTQTWQPFQSFPEWINIDWNSPFTKILDLNGDGRPDVLITEERAWRWYENEGTGGYTEGGYGATSYDEEKKPRLLLNDMVQTIFLADMNGDGITDIVRILNGEISYWPNMGYCNFGPRVSMTNAPWFDNQDTFNPQYVVLADISGTGASDLIYIGRQQCTAWVNLAGNAWSSATAIAPLPGTEPFSKVTVADMLGTGTPCIIWSSPLPQHASAPMRYLDLMGGNKPYLMSSYSNNMGKTVSLTYKQSTQYYLADVAAGHPWATNLPFPVHCVSQVTTADSVSQTAYTQLYTYHHGYYDYPEREFRGFGRVDTTDTDTATGYIQSPPGTGYEEDLDQYPVLTKTWYHTGAWLEGSTLLDAFALEYYPLTWAELSTAPVLVPIPTPSGYVLNAQEQREAYRAMKGQFLRQEVYALDGSALQPVPYSVATNALCVQQVQPLSTGMFTNLYSSFFCYKQQTLTYACERNTADPRVMHELTLSVDLYGNVLESAKVSYPRAAIPSPPVPSQVTAVQAVMLCSYTVTNYTNDVIGAAYHLRVPYEIMDYQLTAMTIATNTLWTVSGLLTDIGSATTINFTDTPTTGLQKRLLSDVRTIYANDTTPSTALALGVLQSLGIPYQQYHLAIANNILSGAAYYNGLVTDAMLVEGAYLREDRIAPFGSSNTSNYWLPNGTITYDTAHFYMPTAYTDPWGNATTVTYWSTVATNYYLLPQTVTDAAGNMTAVTAYNFYNLQPTSVTDPNNNVSQLLYDVLGMPVAMALCSKNNGTEGDILTGIDPQNPTDLANQATFFTNPESVAGALLQGATWRCVYDLTAQPVAVGMIAREFSYYGAHPSPPSPPDNSIMLRLTYTDGLGRLAMNKSQAAPADGTTTLRWIGSGKTVYNNKGNVVMQYEPYFSATPQYDPALQATLGGVTSRIHYDALGRVFRTDMPDGSYTMTTWTAWMQSIYDNNDTVLTSQWYINAMAGTPEEVDAATKAAADNNTPTIIHLDTLARAFYTVQDNAGGVYYESYVTLDILGNRLTIVNNNLVTAITYSYNMLKAVIKQVSIDSGTQYILNDVSNQPLYSWDPANREFHYTYDILRRKLTKQVVISGTTSILEQLTYGEGATTPQTYNLRGMLYQLYDGLGYKVVTAYDWKGNPVQTQQQLLANAQTTDVDWASATLSGEIFITSYTYDAFNRPISVTDPGGNITQHTYDEGGMLYAVVMIPSGGAATPYITEITYDAKYQRQVIAYGNGSKTAYTYDTNTFRLTNLITTKSGIPYQDLSYWYDPVGNITIVSDAAQRAQFFNNAIVLPEWSYTYDAIYRLTQATGRELMVSAAFGTADNYNDASWMGVTYKGNDGACQNYTENYTYDALGNITQLQHVAGVGSYTRTYNYTSGTNQLANTQVGATTYPYAYDALGNMNTMPSMSTLIYNNNNYLSIAINGSVNSYYQYDSSGQRGRKTVVNGGASTQRIYLGNYEIYRTYTGTIITIERRTVHVVDDTGRIAMYEYRTIGTDPSAATLSRYIYSNNIQTATLELDPSGNVISYEEYRPFGTTAFQEMNSAVQATEKRYRFVNKERDDETGFYYMGARYYAPWLGRWMAVDPLESKYAPQSPYCYCSDNPITRIDSTGMGDKDQVKPPDPGTNSVDNTGHAPIIIPNGALEPAQPVNLPNLGQPDPHITPSQDRLKSVHHVYDKKTLPHEKAKKPESKSSSGSDDNDNDNGRSPGKQKVGLTILGNGLFGQKWPALDTGGISLGSFDFGKFSGDEYMGTIALASSEPTESANGTESLAKLSDYLTSINAAHDEEVAANPGFSNISNAADTVSYSDNSSTNKPPSATFKVDTVKIQTYGYNPHVEKAYTVTYHMYDASGKILDTTGLSKSVHNTLQTLSKNPFYAKFIKPWNPNY